MHQAGRPRGLPASPALAQQVRERLVYLQRIGMTERSIASRAGVSQSTVNRIRSGAIVGVSREVAKALLAVRPL